MVLSDDAAQSCDYRCTTCTAATRALHQSSANHVSVAFLQQCVCLLGIDTCLRGMVQRQRLMVQQFYTEVGALEEVMEEAAYALGDEAYSVLTQVPHLSPCPVMLHQEDEGCRRVLCALLCRQ